MASKRFGAGEVNSAVITVAIRLACPGSVRWVLLARWWQYRERPAMEAHLKAARAQMEFLEFWLFQWVITWQNTRSKLILCWRLTPTWHPPRPSFLELALKWKWVQSPDRHSPRSQDSWGKEKPEAGSPGREGQEHRLQCGQWAPQQWSSSR